MAAVRPGATALRQDNFRVVTRARTLEPHGRAAIDGGASQAVIDHITGSDRKANSGHAGGIECPKFPTGAWRGELRSDVARARRTARIF